MIEEVKENVKPGRAETIENRIVELRREQNQLAAITVQIASTLFVAGWRGRWRRLRWLLTGQPAR